MSLDLPYLRKPEQPGDCTKSYVLLLTNGQIKWVESMPAPPQDGKNYVLQCNGGKMEWIELIDFE